MVYFKLNKQSSILPLFCMIVITACCHNYHTRLENNSSYDLIKTKLQDDRFVKKNGHNTNCSDSIILADVIKKYYPNLSFDSEYLSLSKDECIELKWMEKDHIEEFYEFTIFTKAYKLKLNGKQYLVLLGQPAGATGIGVDYKEYECYEFYHKKPILEFSSLQDSPFSLFYNQENDNIGYWALTKEQKFNRDSTYTEIDDYNIVLSVYTNKKRIFSKIIY